MLFEDKGDSVFGGRGYRLDSAPHQHNAVEIAFMLKGEAVLNIEDNSYSVKTGDIFIVFPNQVHSYLSSAPEEYLLYVIPEAIFKPYKNALTQFSPEEPIISESGALKPFFEEIEAEILNPTAYSSELICATSQLLLGKILRKIKLAKPSPAKDTIHELTKFCLQNFQNPISLEALSKHFYLSKGYISHLFSDSLGISFTKYIHTLRINEAASLLKSTSRKITDIAFSCGFTDIRTFNRVFTSIMNTTPSKYRKQN